MPLLEPYHSPALHRAEMRADPSTCPVAGKRTNGQPLPRHVRAALSATGSSFASSDNLSSLKAFHRLKHHPDPDMHFTSGGGTSHSHFGTSTMRLSYSAQPLPPRSSKVDWNQTIPRGMLSGVGSCVPALDRTHDWMSTRNSELDHLQKPRSTLVQRTMRAVEQGRRLESWSSSTTAAFAASSQLSESAKDAVLSRQTFLLSRGHREPLMSLA
jgi:hypothetical protein